MLNSLSPWDRWHGIAVTERVVEQSNQPVGIPSLTDDIHTCSAMICNTAC